MSRRVISMTELIAASTDNKFKPTMRAGAPVFDDKNMTTVGELPMVQRYAVMLVDSYSAQVPLHKENKNLHQEDVRTGWQEIITDLNAHFDLMAYPPSRIVICRDWTVAIYKN